MATDKSAKAKPPYEFRGMHIPEYMWGGLQAYIQRRIPPGGFLEAVLSNDLNLACARADSTNIQNIPAYVAYLYNEAPSICWGSPKRVRDWLNGEDPVAAGHDQDREV